MNSYTTNYILPLQLPHWIYILCSKRGVTFSGHL